MSFYTSLSGLQAAQIDMSTISHNLANVSTNGFKKSSSVFADVMASNFSSDPRRMVGSGTVLAENRQEFGEGSLRSTGSTLDLAISGDGFFAVKAPTGGAALSYTRNGSFRVDSTTRLIVDNQGSTLQAYPVDTQGNVTATGTAGLVNVQIPATSGTAAQTTAVGLGVRLSTAAGAPATAAFNRADPSSYNNATSTQIFDSAGHAMTMTNYWVRDPSGDVNGQTNWQVYSYVGDEPLTAAGAPAATVTFNQIGEMTSPDRIDYDAFNPMGGAAQNVSLDLSGTTAQTTTFSLVSQTQNGATAGQLSGIAIDDEGLITASFSNGDTQMLGKVAVATFADPTGLKQTGGTYWQTSGLSGAPNIVTPNDNGAGKLMTGTLEGSNVDITEELVNLISAQRNFQANAKALDTQTQISQTIFNIRG
jgi:flagellar hook protein FlgE